MRYLYVAATADVERSEDREAVDVIRGLVERQFAPARPLAVDSIDFAFDAGRRQYASIAALEMLTRACPADTLKLLAVTTRDLFLPVLTFVYGQAQLSGRVGIVSLARLRQEFYGLSAQHDIFLERAKKEAMHETGHLFGLVHCADTACAMALSTHVRHIDQKHSAFCARCAARLDHLKRELPV